MRWGLPTLLGPGFTNFEDLVHPLEAAGLVRIVEAGGLAAALASALDAAPLRPRRDPVELPAALRGALARTCAILEDVLPRPARML